MINIKREDIHLISRHSNWSESGVDKTLKDKVYNDAESWHKFLRLLFISLGVSFITAGIIFFFAYNWNDLHKFIKIGLIEGLIIVMTSVVLFTKININIKNIILTGTSILVGVLFAVFGQVYQTGANAYDFFLGWTLAIALWVAVSNFAPLWTVFIILINTTFVLYSEQVAHNWSEMLVVTSLLIINSLFLIFTIIGSKVMNKFEVPTWFTNLLALAVVSLATIGIITGIFEQESDFVILILIVLVLFTVGILYGLKIKSGFYLSIIPFSIIIMISALLIKISNGADMFFGVSLFVIASVTIVINTLITLQKKWKNEE